MHCRHSRARVGAPLKADSGGLRVAPAVGSDAGRPGGDPPGPESSLVKLLTAEHHQTVTDLAMRVLGPAVLAPTGPRAAEWLRPQPLGTPPDSAAPWTDDYLNARARTIYGGSSEIQRDTIATRILGLPPARGA